MNDIPTIASCTYANTVLPPSVFGLVSDKRGFDTTDLVTQVVRDNFKLKEQKAMATNSRRLVKVVIVDPNENIPLEQCLLYSGEEKLTDATDQELFFELDIKDLLAKHNDVRTKTVDKKVKERTEYLEPAKIRDLKMVVVNIATF